MREVILKATNEPTILIDDIVTGACIFAKRYGKLAGMITKDEEKGYILSISSGGLGCSGYKQTIRSVIESSAKFDYTFHVH
jgi:tRNA isopentenyl-2-thiomethyl-A-37 hydroxylase MiaE